MQSGEFIEYLLNMHTEHDSVLKQDDAFALCKRILAAYNYHIYKTELLNNRMLDLLDFVL